MTLVISRATAADAHDIAPLFDGYRQFYQQPSDLSAAYEFIHERLSRGESVIFVCRSGNDAVGFTQLYPCFTSVGMQPIWILNDLYVHADARRSGVGALLMARKHAVATGAKRLELETMLENANAQRFYESMGWERVTWSCRYQIATDGSPG